MRAISSSYKEVKYTVFIWHGNEALGIPQENFTVFTRTAARALIAAARSTNHTVQVCRIETSVEQKDVTAELGEEL